MTPVTVLALSSARFFSSSAASAVNVASDFVFDPSVLKSVGPVGANGFALSVWAPHGAGFEPDVKEEPVPKLDSFGPLAAAKPVAVAKGLAANPPAREPKEKFGSLEDVVEAGVPGSGLSVVSGVLVS